MSMFKRRSFLAGLFTMVSAPFIVTDEHVSIPVAKPKKNDCGTCKGAEIVVHHLMWGGAFVAIPCPTCRTDESEYAERELSRQTAVFTGKTDIYGVDKHRFIPDFLKEEA